jgi:hypothetical protein
MLPAEDHDPHDHAQVAVRHNFPLSRKAVGKVLLSFCLYGQLLLVTLLTSVTLSASCPYWAGSWPLNFVAFILGILVRLLSLAHPPNPPCM